MRYFLYLIVFLLAFNAHAQLDSAARQKRNKRIIMWTSLGAAHVVTGYVFYEWWWKNEWLPFAFRDDGMFNNYSLGVDKCGHAITSYVYAKTLNELMIWRDFPRKRRLVLSTAIPILWATAIEIGDGFTPYGYSWPDLGSNTFGACFALMHELVPYTKNIEMKVSYYPTQYFIDNHFKEWSLTTDYRGHFYWLTFDVHNMLPQKAQKFWPAFLNLGFGYGIDKNGSRFAQPTKREFGISLDWNLRSIPVKNKTVNMVRNLIDIIHFPAPGVKILEGEKAEFKPILLR